ncbi:DHA2 family efflux MFS transporter permease subunit [Nocardia yamanashiensis]|uniref:DHA2 family efflux MFS transporter permease subunit n=1 Tax=Nocardia yamanashiensis TaxID=209247 RepID=UPI001E376B01|nr:DHA2 family efflux MFS transporter permease subunit [Nocardia yamanashiensis]UGT44721.1 DHA2 family efflux MFS transporter permease subunit [Nocardia yamanashiensis]
MAHRVSGEAGGIGARAVSAVVCAASFLTFLDVSVVNIAFPSIARSFSGTGQSVLTWVVSGYSVTFAAGLAPAGRLADVIGRGRLFLLGLAGFVLTSLACALAPSAAALIAARLLQGVTAAVVVPASVGLLLGVVAPERRPGAIGTWTATNGLGAVLGPVLGGLLVDQFGWRGIFAINIPIGLVLVVIGLRFVPMDRPRARAPLPDALGALLFATGTGSIVAAITRGQDWGWTAPLTVSLLLGGLVLLLLALLRARTHRSPAVDLGLWRNGLFARTSLASAVIGLALFAHMLIGPIFLAEIWHYSVVKASFVLTIAAVGAMLTSIVVGRIGTPHNAGRLAALGALLFAAGATLLGTHALTAAERLWTVWAPAAAVIGLGIGLSFAALGIAASAAIPEDEFAAGLGMNFTVRQVGGGFGIAILAALVSAHGIHLLDAVHELYRVEAVVLLAAAPLCLTLRPARTTAPVTVP